MKMNTIDVRIYGGVGRQPVAVGDVVNFILDEQQMGTVKYITRSGSAFVVACMEGEFGFEGSYSDHTELNMLARDCWVWPKNEDDIS